MLGAKLRQLRVESGLLQREVASELQVDIAYVSKIENNEKPLSRLHLRKLALLFRISEEELNTFWLADKILNLTKDESLANGAIKLAQFVILKRTKS